VGWSVEVGPLIGGLLSKPAEQYPTLFGHLSFFKLFPYLLPNLAVASLGVVGLIVAIFTLTETKRDLVKTNITEREELLIKEVRKIHSILYIKKEYVIHSLTNIFLGIDFPFSIFYIYIYIYEE
jgi:hypothetical protein